MTKAALWIIFILLLLIFLTVLCFRKIFDKTTYTYEEVEDAHRMNNESDEYNARDFFRTRRLSFKNRAYSRLIGKRDFAGVYIIHNKTKNMYYVGQGNNVIERSSKHFYGYGNGDVYADFKYGDYFTIRFIPLAGSGFSNLNDLERNAINKYNAYYGGYNRTRGNY